MVRLLIRGTHGAGVRGARESAGMAVHRRMQVGVMSSANQLIAKPSSGIGSLADCMSNQVQLRVGLPPS